MVNSNARPDSFKISNLTLLLVIALLTGGILLDGILYNKPVVQQAIYPIDNAQSIELHHDGQLLLAFRQTDTQWTQTHPFKAPAQKQRVQILLDTNHYSRREYSESQLPGTDIFSQPVKLTVDGATYELGTVEPVSNLRYVRANKRIYLQPDTVIPLLSASNNAFVDLKITAEVEQISIGESSMEQPERWSNLQAIDIVESPSGPGLDVTLKQHKQTVNLIARKSDNGYVLSAANGFHYLLNTATAESIGLAERLKTP